MVEPEAVNTDEKAARELVSFDHEKSDQAGNQDDCQKSEQSNRQGFLETEKSDIFFCDCLRHSDYLLCLENTSGRATLAQITLLKKPWAWLIYKTEGVMID